MKQTHHKKFSWTDLPKPFFALAPMDDVTDTVFRRIAAGAGRPDVMFTEFVSADGLVSTGRDRLIAKLAFTETERPLIAQIWGRNPQNLASIAAEIADMGFDGIDINMGCPDKSVLKQGCGAALIENPDLAKAQVAAVRQAVAGRIAVSVKTRIGLKTVKTESWITFLLSLGLDALTVHPRTAREMSRVPARWEEVANAAKIRDDMGVSTVIIGNGDIDSRARGVEYADRYHADGIMIGRGIFHDPWIFSDTGQNKTPSDRLSLLDRHLALYARTRRDGKHYNILKKFFKIYVQGFEQAHEWRNRLMETTSIDEARKIVNALRVEISRQNKS